MQIDTRQIDTRFKAFYVHLLISILLLLGMLAVIFFVWYPYQLIYAGGIDGLKILIGVDLVLGPLLTLIAFVPGKKGLKFDLSLIALIQVSCLLFGMWLIYSQRPLVQVVIDDGVHLLSAADIEEHNIEINNFAGRYPKNVMIELPEDENSWGSVKFSTEFADLKPFSMRDDLYLPMSSVNSKQYADRLTAILSRTKSPELDALNKEKTTDCDWMPITSVHVNGFACYSKEAFLKRMFSKLPLRYAAAV